MVEDMTTLSTTLDNGPDRNAPVLGAGQIFFHLKGALTLMASMRVTGTVWLGSQ